MIIRRNRRGLRWAFFGSSLVSAYWNGAATYYRGIIRALAELGHEVTFYEPDAYDRQKNRDIADPPWARVKVYLPTLEAMSSAIHEARTVDVVVKASGVGVLDEELEEAVLRLKSPGVRTIFWDVDAPATLDRVLADPAHPFRRRISGYDMIFTYGGGEPVVSRYRSLGARCCVPVYNGLDRSTHFRVPPDSRFQGLLGFLGNRLPDREARVEQFFLNVARQLPHESFLLGGSGWETKEVPVNVRYLGHVYTGEHNAFNSSLRAVLNLSRDSMAAYGFSPATRVFEAAGAGACVITDAWEGIERFFEPDREILVARDPGDLVRLLRELSPERARSVGEAAFRRVCSEHTYEQRARLVEKTLEEVP